MSEREQASEIERLRAWVADLQSGMYVNCVYCGHRYGPGETTPVSMADALKAHIAQCPEHPMSRLLNALKAIEHIPAKPFPDPVAHSWQAYATAVLRAYSDIQRIARAAIANAMAP